MGFDALTGAMLAARDGANADGALAGVFAIAEAYVGFALGSPGHFRAMFHPNLGPREPGGALDLASTRAFAVLVDALAAAQREGTLREGDVAQHALASWALVHGLASLALDHHLARKGLGADPFTLARGAAETLYRGLRP